MTNRSRVSWVPLHSRRLFGLFLGWTPQGLAKVSHGSRVEYIDAGDLTWELN